MINDNIYEDEDEFDDTFREPKVNDDAGASLYFDHQNTMKSSNFDKKVPNSKPAGETATLETEERIRKFNSVNTSKITVLIGLGCLVLIAAIIVILFFFVFKELW